jgi:hypothetical protein
LPKTAGLSRCNRLFVIDHNTIPESGIDYQIQRWEIIVGGTKLIPIYKKKFPHGSVTQIYQKDQRDMCLTTGNCPGDEQAQKFFL